MSKVDDGGLAFPGKRHEQAQIWEGGGIEWAEAEYPGMSLRDWFAGQAMASGVFCQSGTVHVSAEWCYAMADAMIAARKAHLE